MAFTYTFYYYLSFRRDIRYNEVMEFLNNPNTLWALLAVAFGAWSIFSWMLAYHWRSYGRHVKAMTYTTVTYFVGSGLIFASIAILIFSL